MTRFGWWEETADRVEEVKAGCPGTGADCGPVNTLIMLLADEAFNPESWDDDDDDDFYDDEDYYDDDEYDYFDYDDYYDDEDYYDEDYEDDDDDDDDEKNDRGKVEGDSTKPTFNENLDERYKTNHFPAESFITSEESEVGKLNVTVDFTESISVLFWWYSFNNNNNKGKFFI